MEGKKNKVMNERSSVSNRWKTKPGKMQENLKSKVGDIFGLGFSSEELVGARFQERKYFTFDVFKVLLRIG